MASGATTGMLGPTQKLDFERRMLLCRGALYESDVFSALMPSPFVARSFEFAVADGAVVCSDVLSESMSYAERLWTIFDRRSLPHAEELILFDVKSTASPSNDHQAYRTIPRQHRHVAFYICVCATDASYVEVIPNYSQGTTGVDEGKSNESTESNDDDEALLMVNKPRRMRLPANAYGALDPGGAAFRMPIGLLPEAMRRIRECARAGTTYVNPWSLVEHAGWKPKTTRDARGIVPAESTQHFTSFQAVMEIFRWVGFEPSGMAVDIVAMQPRIADLKLLLPGQHRSRLRQVFVQHKLDDTVRAAGGKLHRVVISRRDGKGNVSWHFQSHDRHDFLWYQFYFAHGRTEVVFAPERELPDDFYTTLSRDVDFEIPALQPYRFVMDEQGGWVGRVKAIVEANPRPRKEGRPARRGVDELASDADELDQAPGPDDDDNNLKVRGFADGLAGRRTIRFFYRFLEECAARRSGAIVVLPRDHPYGDFAFLRYAWTEAERETFVRTARPPVFMQQLPGNVPVVPFIHHAQDVEVDFRGPALRPHDFWRLDSSGVGRLLFWDLAGQDTDHLVPAVIPSEDVLATAAQRAVFDTDGGAGRTKMPILSALLGSGLYASEYMPAQGGPAVPGGSLHALWQLLDSFCIADTVFHPPGMSRQAQNYRCLLKDAHQRSLQDYTHL